MRNHEKNDWHKLWKKNIERYDGLLKFNLVGGNLFLKRNLKPKEIIFSYSNGYLIGKTGLEHTYDDHIRGQFGKKIFEVDASGKFLKELDS